MEILDKIKHLEAQSRYKEVAEMLFLQDILTSELGISKMKYYDFISRSIHMLNDDFRVEVLYTDTPRKPYFPILIEAYKMVGGQGNLAFYKEEKFPLESIFMKLMFTPKVYEYSRVICEEIESLINDEPLFLKMMSPQQILKLANSR